MFTREESRMKRSLVLRREALTELVQADLAAVGAGTSIACVDPTPAVASLKYPDQCLALSLLGCYSWHTEEC
jgi:hypothetical protein